MLGLALLLVLIWNFPVTHGLIVEKLLLGCAAIVAGVFLWQGHRLMYWIGLLSWLMLFIWAAHSLYVVRSDFSSAGQMSSYFFHIAYFIGGLSVLPFLVYKLSRLQNTS